MKLPSKNLPKISHEEAFSKIQSIDQTHLFSHWHALSASQKDRLLQQIAALDLDLFKRQKQLLASPQNLVHGSISPFKNFKVGAGSQERLLGRKSTQEGKNAFLVMAGGQASRLRCSGPKGAFKVSLIKGKSLFQMVAEKVAAASRQVGRPLQIAFMTSHLNRGETEAFFAEHRYFGLEAGQLSFFEQPVWPVLRLDGTLFLEEPDTLAQGPNGNGSIFSRLVEVGLWEQWKKEGIENVHVIPVDNPLALPFDYELLGCHIQNGAEISVKSCFRKSAQEKVGVLADLNGKSVVVEYSELCESEKEAKDAAGNFLFQVANLGLYVFSMDFIYRAARIELPLHLAKKAVKEVTPEGTQLPEAPNAWKFEEFIFDVFPFARSVQALIASREDCFAPLKNLKGEDSIDTVRAALLNYDRRIFSQITGSVPPPDAVFELAPQFYYPTDELLKKWKGRPFPNKDYIHE